MSALVELLRCGQPALGAGVRRNDHLLTAPAALLRPGLVVVTRDASGQLRSAAWTLRPAEDPGRTESLPRQMARGAAGAVDLVTAPVQMLLFMLGVVRMH